MDFNKLTIKSQEAVAGAQELARRAGNPEVYPEHLLLALLEQELARTLVERSGYELAALHTETEEKLARKPRLQGAAQQPQASTQFSRVLDQAEEEMRKLGDEFVSTEHLLLGMKVLERGKLLAALK